MVSRPRRWHSGWGPSSVNLLYRWKREFISQAGVAAESLSAGAATGGGTPAGRAGARSILKKPCPFSAAAVADVYAAIQQVIFQEAFPVSVVPHIERFSVWLSRLEA
ncbi:MAG: hypothetical protein R3C18_25705 [Planctomycetaceae bacterium]